MGYGQVMDSQSFVMGVPAGVQTAFMIEGSFNRILPSAELRMRRILDRLDKVEELIDDTTEDVTVEAVGNIKINDKAFQRQVARYMWHLGALANLLQVPPNPYDQRFVSWGGGGGGLNVAVSR